MKELISNLISKFYDDYYDSSPTMKIVLMASVAAAFVMLIVISFRACTSSPTQSQQRLRISALTETDENGDKWTLEPLSGQLSSAFKNSDKKPGPPLLVKADIRIKRRQASIGLIVEGQAGEKYVGGAKKNGNWQPAPKLKILDETGKQLDADQFKYG